MEKGTFQTFKNGILWSTRNIHANVINTLFVSYISFYATDVLGMFATMIATVLLITKLFDGISDLIAGFIVDNTHTRWGKARPYDLCIPFITLFTIFCFTAPKISPMGQAVYIGVMYVLVQAVFNTLLGASDNVYLLRAFTDAKERNNVFGISSVFAQAVGITLGVIVPLLVAQAGTSQSGWTRMVIIATVPFTLIGLIRFFTIKEKMEEQTGQQEAKAKKEKAEKVDLKDGFQAILKNRYILILTLAVFIIVSSSGLLNTSAVYYFKYFVGDTGKMSLIGIGSYAALLMLVAFVPLSNKFGKANVMKFGLAVAVAGCLIRWFGGTNEITLVFGMGLMMFGIMPISVYFPLFLFDCMDFSEWKTGKRVEGVLAVFPSFANKVAAGISASIATFILGAAGYDGTLEVQSKQAMGAINLCFNIIPSILLIFMTVLVFVCYDLDKVMPEVTEELKELKAR